MKSSVLTPRARLFKNVKKIHKIIIKNPDRRAEMTNALKTIIEDHLSISSQDRALRVFLLHAKDNTTFCEEILRQLYDNLEGPLSLVIHVDSSQPLVSTRKKKKSSASTSVLSKLEKKFYEKRYRLDYKIDEDFPACDDIALHYRSILDRVFQCTFVSLYDFFKCVENTENAPILIPLHQRLKMFLDADLLSFLPLENILSFFREWDGMESSLEKWHHQHRFEVLRDVSNNETQSMMEHLSLFYKCCAFSRLNTSQIHEFYKLSLRFPFVPVVSILANIKSNRRTFFIKKRFFSPDSVEFPPWFLCVLEWLPGVVSFKVSPKPVSARAFMTKYFDPSTYQKKNVLMCDGKPYKITFKKKDGSSLVQDEILYANQKKFFREGKMSFTVFLERGGKDYVDLCQSWLSDALRFLPSCYNIMDMTHRIMESILTESITVYEFLHRVFHLLGRLHPSFALSTYHCVLKNRLCHFYFHLGQISTAPICLLFPEYDAFCDWEKTLIDSEWSHAFDQFCTFLWKKRLPPRSRLPLQDIRLDKTRHLSQNLVDVVDKYPMHLNAEWIPQGLALIGITEDAPSYFHPNECFLSKNFEKKEEEEDSDHEFMHNDGSEEEEEEEEETVDYSDEMFSD